MAKHTPVEVGDGRILVTRRYAGWALGRHPDLIRRLCDPVACSMSGALLYDLDQVCGVLGDTPRRKLTTTAA